MKNEAQKSIDKKKGELYKVKSQDVITTIKDVDLTKRMVTGLYNTYYYFDSDSDVLVDGSSRKSLLERGPQTNAIGKIKHALFHDLTKLPGKLLLLEEREVEVGGQKVKGLYFETKMLNTVDGNDTLVKYQEGVYDNHSIGFRYKVLEMVEQGAADWTKWLDMLINPEQAAESERMFIVKEIQLFEGSTVSFGANSLTPYLGSKSEDKEVQKLKLFERMDLLHKQLKVGQLSDESLYDVELQISQIKQMIGEVMVAEPFKKSTPKAKGPEMENTGINYSYLAENFKL